MRQRPPPPSEKARQALAKYRETISATKRRDIEQAIKHLRKIDAPINFSTVSHRAKVSRKTIYKHKDLVAVIEQFRDRPAAGAPSSTGRDTSIVAALRAQLAAKDAEIRTLRTKLAEQESTIALLYGQLDSYTT